MRFRLFLVLIIAAAGIAGWQAETRAALKQRLLLRSLVAQLEPLGSLSYGQTTAHFWGSGQIEDLRFAPAEALRTQYGLAPDFALHIPLLRYRDWQQGEGWPAAARFRFDTATLPMPTPWPSEASGTLDWDYRATAGELRLAFTVEAAGAAAINASLALELARADHLGGATLINAALHFRDLGLAQGQRAALALRLGADPQNANAALADALEQWLTQQGLPPDATLHTALRDFAQEPLALTLRLDPPGALRPETLPQFAPADRIAALGLSLEPR